jgi:hypothetical protein
LVPLGAGQDLELCWAGHWALDSARLCWVERWAGLGWGGRWPGPGDGLGAEDELGSRLG